MRREIVRTLVVAGCFALLASRVVTRAHADPNEQCGGTVCAASTEAHVGREAAHDYHDHGHDHASADPRAKGQGDEHGEEGHLELSPEAMKELDIRVLSAAPAKLNVTLSLTGKLVPHEDRVTHVTSRYPGLIREVRKRLGDPVARGETVAVVENNQTLQPFEVKSQIPGIVVRRHAIIGEAVNDSNTLFDIADYGELFADFFVFPAAYSKVQLGQRVIVRIEGKPAVESTISFLSPVTDADTQSRFVRAVLPNAGGGYQPGMFVTGDVVLVETEVAIAVDNSAIRTSEGKTVVFVEEKPGHFEARPVLTGKKDKDATQILKGLKPGERYAAGNTFILQAELEKGEAEHAH